MLFRPCILLVLVLTVSFSAAAQEKPKESGGKASAAEEAKATAQEKENEELQKVIQASTSQQQAVENLDKFLKKYPNAARREEIERTIYKLASDLKDKSRQIEYAERIIAHDGGEYDMVTSIITLLRDRKAPGDIEKAISYCDQLSKGIEEAFSSRQRPAKIGAGTWELQRLKMLSAVTGLRGQLNFESGEFEKAEADLLKSYKLAPVANTANLLGEIAERKKNLDQAVDYYIEAFVRSISGNLDIERTDLRHKLGVVYTSKHGSESGLGDRILKAFDTITKQDEERLAKFEPPKPNQKATDHLQFRLTRLNGSEVRLADFKGKVVVANFWATWCGPCRIEMPELERAMEKYKDDKDVVFLAINTDDDREGVDSFVKGQKLKLPVVYANQLDSFFGINTIPTTLIFDRSGQVSYRQSGFNTNADFVAAISERIDAAKGK